MADGPGTRVHGGVAHAAQGASVIRRRAIADLSTCVDAFGVFEPVEKALREVDALRSYQHYPDPECKLARARLAEFADVAVDCIDVAPGAAELIWTLTRALLRTNDPALVWKPCFSEFEHAVAAVGARVSAHWFGAGSVEREVAKFFEAAAKERPKIAYLCAPTCPLGQWIPIESLRGGALRVPDTTFVIDQSYLNLSKHAQELTVRPPANVVLLRSLTKELGLPGVRVGYAVMSPALRSRVQSHRPCWSVGVHAQAVLQVYFECLPLLAPRRELLLQHANALATALQGLGLSSRLADTHYFSVDVSAGVCPTSASVASSRLVGEGVAVRDCTSFGLPNHLRVVAHPEQQKLIDGWARIAGESREGVEL